MSAEGSSQGHYSECFVFASSEAIFDFIGFSLGSHKRLGRTTPTSLSLRCGALEYQPHEQRAPGRSTAYAQSTFKLS